MSGLSLRCAGFAVIAMLLAACAAKPVSEMPAAATPAATAAATPAEPEADPEPLPERHEASAQCWMRYDKSGGTLEAKAALVEKCINDKMAGVDRKPKPAAKPRRATAQ